MHIFQFYRVLTGRGDDSGDQGRHTASIVSLRVRFPSASYNIASVWSREVLIILKYNKIQVQLWINTVCVTIILFSYRPKHLESLAKMQPKPGKNVPSYIYKCIKVYCKLAPCGAEKDQSKQKYTLHILNSLWKIFKDLLIK